eukprot:CAMPEP_0172586554 /NCGR_PEP_ID=MMETSP1068-20121228/5918_1 /TAXON_ID=35684 /ORGANISM="Pseudopedinella elastica, Strain CCMP716" /LENGTH=99 /DNA_ID=CAMNT_0013381405 /DNA_START=160 /DNA_END=459 /DNA_ORIENTATION=+
MAADPLKKAEFIDMVAEKTSLSKKDVNEVISASFETIMDAVTDGKKVTFLGFGSFEPRDRKARTGRNPKTGEPLQIAASRAPAFAPSKVFKEKVKGKKL